jgi:hypothetical protein
MPNSLPSSVTKYFWGDDLQELNWPVHKKYISQTLLDKGDLPSVKWLLNQVSGQEILDLLPSLKLSPKSRNFWQIYLS